ncbi:MAG: tyrosine-type recombinase/integrase [Thermoplasmata archaeon]
MNGLRRVEVLRLRVKDVGLEDGTLRVLGKGRGGGKWRTISMHPSVRTALTAAVAGKGPEERLLPFGPTWADLLLRWVSERAGLHPEVMVSHHDLRRTFGRLAHKAGIDLEQLQLLYGHRSVDVTVHYIGLDAQWMREGLERYSAFLGGEPQPLSEMATAR